MARKGEGQTVLITGASGGIGLELARCFAKDGYNLVLVARSEDKLRLLAGELAGKFQVNVVPIGCDLSRIGAGSELVQTLDTRKISVDVLVNNAGFGQNGLFSESDLAGQLGMVDLNMRALVELTGLLWPRILRGRRGGVLNIGSTASFQPGPMMAVYCATKAFVLSFSEALWEEARGSGVHVSCLCPGATATGFSERAGVENTRIFKGTVVSARKVARIGYRAYQANRRVKVPGLANQLMVASVPFSPRTIVLRIARSLMTPPASVKA